MRTSAVLAFAAALASALACTTDQPSAPGGGIRAATLASPASDPTPATIALEKIGGYAGGGLAAAEITAYDAVSKRLFVVNGALGTVDVLDLRDPSQPARVATLDFGGPANSVAAHGGLVAVAVEGASKTDPGTVALYRATTLQRVSSVVVGALPDMVTFSKSGRWLLVANEGEPNDAYTIDPEGSVSIVDVSNANRPTVRTVGFTAFDGQIASLRARGVRIYGPGASVARDLEPEYIAVAEDERTAWVTLQENNALAIIDIEQAVVREIVPLGYKDHRVAGNAFDASDRDGPANGPAVNIRNWPVLGMYQPDAIAAYEVGGQTYLVTANEGDSRDWAGLREESRVAILPLEPSIFTPAACGGPCNANARLGRLTVTNQHGRNAVSGRFDTLYVLGGRSFSIRSADGALVWDSGDELEQRTSALTMVRFNASSAGDALDDRSDNKGPEPEGVVVGRLGAKVFAFVGLERTGGVIVYDVTSPTAPFFVTYVNTRQGGSGDLGPEGLAFIPARQSPTREPLLVVGNEISGTTAIFRIELR